MKAFSTGCIGVLSCLLAFSSGCPDKGSATGSAPGPRLNLWHTYNPHETATLNRILERIQRRHGSRWRIQPTVIPFSRAQNKFRQAAERCGASAPDVFRAELPWLAEFVSKGLILPYPDNSGEESYLPQAWSAAIYKGKRWTLPASLDCLALLYNRALVSSPPATLDQLLEQARMHTLDHAGRTPDKPDFDGTRVKRWGFYVRPDGYWFLPFLWAMGGKLLDPETGEVFIDEPRAIEALAWYRDLIRKHRVAPPRPSPSNDYEDQMRRFGAGTLAMMVNGPWATSALLSTPVFSKDPTMLGVAPFPRGGTKALAAPLSGHGFVVSRCAKDPKAAWALAKSLSDQESQVQFALRNNLLPSLRAVYFDSRVRKNRLVRGFRDAIARARPRPQHPAIARIFDDFNPAVQAVLLGEARPDQALAGVGRAWRRLLGTAPASAPSRPGGDR
jgi:arabinogalactan oligomer/maltooligosaccharide transport system substrate-binding protein